MWMILGIEIDAIVELFFFRDNVQMIGMVNGQCKVDITNEEQNSF
jgi:hypothetical protein